jgi:hypothetical protein
VKVVSESAAGSGEYTMTATDYGIMASATSTSSLTIILPLAATSAGMMVFVKKVDGNSNPVIVSRNGSSDTIEGQASINLNKQYDSLELISDGVGVWYIFDSAKCGAFIS